MLLCENCKHYAESTLSTYYTCYRRGVKRRRSPVTGGLLAGKVTECYAERSWTASWHHWLTGCCPIARHYEPKETE